MSHKHFDEAHVLHELKHYLPSQTPLKDFIHHNSLHAFQHMKFYDAIFKASKIFGYQVTLQLTEFRELYEIGRIKDEVLERIIAEEKGQHQVEQWKKKLLHKDYDTHNAPRIGLLRALWKDQYKIDLDNLVQPLLFRILCSYLDQGISIWKFPIGKDGFLSSIKELEKNSFASFFKTVRAKHLLLQDNC
ncbi:MAG TPA: putative inorganic carbon transporter subunit DabA, partial [Segetibacter sp.]